MKRRRPLADLPTHFARFEGSPWDTDGTERDEAVAAWSEARRAWAAAHGVALVDLFRAQRERRLRTTGAVDTSE